LCVQEKQAARAESEDGEEDDESAQQAQETLDLLNESKQENNGEGTSPTLRNHINHYEQTLENLVHMF
jgi:hypothetical protein